MLLYHPATTDIAMEVIKRFYVPEKQIWKLKVQWWNIGRRHPPFCMYITQNIKLTAEQFREWTAIKPEEVR